MRGVNNLFLTNNFDIVRLFGAFQVAIANHYISFFAIDVDVSLMKAFSGVPIFFFLAGIFIPMSIKNNNLFDFITNRILRIFPLMWISIILGVILMFIAGYYPKTNAGNFIAWLFSYLVYPLYTPEYLRDYGVGAINGALWIIPTQITFYIFALCFYAFVKKNRGIWIVITFISLLSLKLLLLNVLMPNAPIVLVKVINTSFLVQFPMFLFGIFVSENMNFFVKIVKGKFLLFLFIHLFFFYLLKYGFSITVSALATDPTIFKYPFMITLGLLVLSAGYTMPKLSDNILHRNDISYDIYVFHMPVANFIIYTMGKGFVNCTIAIILTGIISIVSYKYIEKNISKLKKKSLRN